MYAMLLTGMIMGLNAIKDKMAFVWQRARVSFNKYGAWHICRAALCAVCKPVMQYEYFKVFMKDLTQKTDARVDHEMLTLNILSNMRELQENVDTPLSTMNPKTVASMRFSQGHVCVVAQNKAGEQVFSLWLVPGGCKVEKDFRLGSDEAYFYSAYTVPEQRGKGVYPKALEQLSQHLASQGKKKLCCMILPGWRASIRGVEKAQFKHIRDLKFVRFFMMEALTLPLQ